MEADQEEPMKRFYRLFEKIVIGKRFVSVSPTEKKILLQMAKLGEGTRYDISKKGRISYSVVHSAVDRLRKTHMLHKVRDEQSKRNLKMEVYRLTLAGFLCALASSEGDTETRRNIIENHPRILPNVTGKWNFFKKYKIEEIIASQLHQHAINSFDLVAKELSQGKSEREIRQIITSDFYGDLIGRLPTMLYAREMDEETFRGVMVAFTSDPTLQELTYPLLKKTHEFFCEGVRTCKELLRFYENKKSKRR